MKSKTRHDVKMFAMTSKAHHDVKTFFMTSKSSSLRQNSPFTVTFRDSLHRLYETISIANELDLVIAFMCGLCARWTVCYFKDGPAVHSHCTYMDYISLLTHTFIIPAGMELNKKWTWTLMPK